MVFKSFNVKKKNLLCAFVQLSLSHLFVKPRFATFKAESLLGIVYAKFANKT